MANNRAGRHGHFSPSAFTWFATMQAMQLSPTHTAAMPLEQTLLSQQDLALRWGRSVSSIGWSSAIGVGPKYVKHAGAVKYPVEEVQKYERALRMH
jgi:hypothetical protein